MFNTLRIGQLMYCELPVKVLQLIQIYIVCYFDTDFFFTELYVATLPKNFIRTKYLRTGSLFSSYFKVRSLVTIRRCTVNY